MTITTVKQHPGLCDAHPHLRVKRVKANADDHRLSPAETRTQMLKEIEQLLAVQLHWRSRRCKSTTTEVRMRSLLILLLAFTALPALSQQATPPSDESLRQLFELTHVTRILDTYMSTLDSGMQAGMRAALQGATPNAKQQQIIADMRAQIVKEFRATLSWPKLEPIYMDIYRRNFTQQQVNDMLAFYRTPSGRAMVEKMPAVMQQAGQAVQGMLPDLIQHMKQIQSDGIARLRAAGNDN